jgi:hypothetical protein
MHAAVSVRKRPAGDGSVGEVSKINAAQLPECRTGTLSGFPAEGCLTVCIDSLGKGFYPNDIRYRLKTGHRRYLCEARDNYVAKSEFLSSRLAARN